MWASLGIKSSRETPYFPELYLAQELQQVLPVNETKFKPITKTLATKQRLSLAVNYFPPTLSI